MAPGCPDELQARLAIRAIMHAHHERQDDGALDPGPQEDDPPPLSSRLRGEIDDVLQKGLARRLSRLEGRVKDLAKNRTTAELLGRDLNGGSSILNDAVGIQTDECRHDEPFVLTFGPTDRQKSLPTPQETPEPMVTEAAALRTTMANLKQSIAARESQTKELNEQLGFCKGQLAARSEEAEEAKRMLQQLDEDPSKIRWAQEECARQRRARVQELRQTLEEVQGQAKRFLAVARQQSRYFLQRDLVAHIGGKKALNRHPCGEIFLVPEPESVAGEQVKAWDVGTAVANPYVCDSWPFEPNVLARRCPQDPPMVPFSEETEEELAEAEGKAVSDSLRRQQIAALRMPLPALRMPQPRRAVESDDEDDDYGGGGDTVRSV